MVTNTREALLKKINSFFTHFRLWIIALIRVGRVIQKVDWTAFFFFFPPNCKTVVGGGEILKRACSAKYFHTVEETWYIFVCFPLFSIYAHIEKGLIIPVFTVIINLHTKPPNYITFLTIFCYVHMFLVILSEFP